jgi:anaerobic ribonucleoside-triphosphate reductase activating protein
MLKYARSSIAFQEVPNEISLSYEVCGCPLRCDGCHSPELRQDKGFPLDASRIFADSIKYDGLISCVLFMGGDWVVQDIIGLLSFVKSQGLKTALYSGFDSVPDDITSRLDYLKVGPYKKELGGLNSPVTNQQFFHIPTLTNLNHLFL